MKLRLLGLRYVGILACWPVSSAQPCIFSSASRLCRDSGTCTHQLLGHICAGIWVGTCIRQLLDHICAGTQVGTCIRQLLRHRTPGKEAWIPVLLGLTTYLHVVLGHQDGEAAQMVALAETSVIH